MRRVFRGGAALLWLGPATVWAAGPATPSVSTPTISSATTAATAEPADPEQPFSADEGEAPDDHLMPNAAYAAKKPYDQAHEALQRAEEFWKQKQALKTSDAALEAYDDLMEIHFSRRHHRKARRKLQGERHRAAEIYVDSSIMFIKEDAKRQGLTAAAKQEARDRLGDLRDVSREYLELQKKVVNAIVELQ